MGLRGQGKDTAAGGAVERVLVVTSGAITLAVSAPVIEGILPPEESGAAIVVSTRGITYQVRDLTRCFGQTPTVDAAERRVILCGSRDAHRGFRVDQVLGLTDVDTRQIRPLPPHFAGDERGRFKGLFLYESGVALWVNPDWLLGPELEQAEAPAQGAGTTPPPKVYQLEVVDAEGAN